MHRSVLIATLAGIIFGAVHAGAQDKDQPAKKEPAKKEPAKQNSSDDILNDLLKDDLGFDLTGGKEKEPTKQEDKLPDGALDLAEEFPEGKQNPLSGIGRGMRQSQSRLQREHDPGAKTQDLQKQIVADIEALLKKKRQQQKKQKPNPNQNQKQANRTNPKQQKKPGEGQRNPDNKPAAESNAKAGKGKAEKVEEPLPFGMAADVWGHLKERERQILIQAARMEYLDEYNQMIKDYFSTLAKSRR